MQPSSHEAQYHEQEQERLSQVDQPPSEERLSLNFNKQQADIKQSSFNIAANGSNLAFSILFELNGAQGFAGVLVDNRSCRECVFKSSTDFNFVVEHEAFVGLQLNELTTVCPHFPIYYDLGYCQFDAIFLHSLSNRKFDVIRSSLHLTPAEGVSNGDGFTRAVVLLEKLESLSFETLAQVAHRHVVVAQMAMVLLGLQIAQDKLKFTHYDCHVENVLMQRCSANTYFLYDLNGESILVPTYGLYPVIIDYGRSFINKLDETGQRLRTDVEFYQYGCQSAFFDPINDTHRFVLSTLWSIEMRDRSYEWLANKLKRAWRRLPLLRKSGSSYLPNNLRRNLKHFIRENCDIFQHSFLTSLHLHRVLEILSSLCQMPIIPIDDCLANISQQEAQNHSDQLHLLAEGLDEFSAMFDTVILNIYSNKNGADKLTRSQGLCLLQLLVTLAIKSSSGPVPDSWFVGQIQSVFQDVADLPFTFAEFSRVCSNIAKGLNILFGVVCFGNLAVLKRAQQNTHIKTPLDCAVYLLKNCTPHFCLQPGDQVYNWDVSADQRSQSVQLTQLSGEQIAAINRAAFSRKGPLLKKLLGLKS